MKTVNLYEAKTHLSRLVGEATRGERIVIARHGTPLVELVPLKRRRRSEAFGMDRGVVSMAPDFDETPSDFEDYTA